MIKVQLEDFDIGAEIEALRAGHTGIGGICSFMGTVRDIAGNEAVSTMTLEHYPGMTENHLTEICEQACKQWAVLDALILHRVGEIEIGDPIVLVSIWTAHRGDAFDACRFIMEDLKSKAPFWKKEMLKDGERWVESNTSGYSS